MIHAPPRRCLVAGRCVSVACMHAEHMRSCTATGEGRGQLHLAWRAAIGTTPYGALAWPVREERVRRPLTSGDGAARWRAGAHYFLSTCRPGVGSVGARDPRSEAIHTSYQKNFITWPSSACSYSSSDVDFYYFPHSSDVSSRFPCTCDASETEPQSG